MTPPPASRAVGRGNRLVSRRSETPFVSPAKLGLIDSFIGSLQLDRIITSVNLDDILWIAPARSENRPSLETMHEQSLGSTFRLPKSASPLRADLGHSAWLADVTSCDKWAVCQFTREHRLKRR